jgi:cyclophilin family peptidyl-prolyl cis-trans isomerase/protein-disulfide isomerase
MRPIRHSLTGLLLLLVLMAGCQSAAPTAAPTPLPTATPYVVTLPPPETPDPFGFSTTDYTQGPNDAPVTIIHYADFQCAPCADVARSLAILLDDYPDTVRVIWRHFPDPVSNNKAALALMGAEAAAEQDRFWEMHDLLFAEQDTWRDLSPDAFRATLIAFASTLGLDLDAFQTFIDRDPTLLVDQYRLEALAFDLAGIPTLLINGQPYSGRYDRYGLDEAVRFYALAERHYPDQPELVIDLDRAYQAILHTEHGAVTLDLFVDRAPVAVNNFVFLARAGWFDDITFHRVLPGLFAQTGDPSGTGLGGPGYSIADEFENGLVFDREGMVAMASTRGIPNSGGSQFFITYGPLAPEREWNEQFTIFGMVSSGMDAIRALTPRDPQDPVLYPDPVPGDRLISVEIIEQ